MRSLQSLHIYPIKGARRCALEEAVVAPRGLAGDRRWMLVDHAGVFISQRTRPRLALIHTHLHADVLAVEAPGMAPLTLRRPEAGAARETVQIWNDEVAALLAEPKAHAWFSRFLGQECRLVFMDAAARRPLNPAVAGSGAEVSFADAAPVLLTTQASLDALNARLDEPISMHRFRPNFVVSGTEAFAEDRWQRVQVGRVPFRVIAPAGRCAVITTDQETAEVGKEPLRTLSTFRKRGNLVYFGMYLIPAAAGRVRVGEAVTVEA